jgi:hypothetical protein
MIFGMTLFTFLHVLLSVIGIGSGFVISFGLLTARRLEGWTALFLATTVLTSVTGFLFPFHRFLPSHGVGIISLIVLAIAIFARYARRLVGAWRRTYVISATTALPKRLRPDRATLPKGAGAKSNGPDTIPASRRDRATSCAGALYRARCYFDDEVSRHSRPYGLTIGLNARTRRTTS